jgi:hypothetical protein
LPNPELRFRSGYPAAPNVARIAAMVFEVGYEHLNPVRRSNFNGRFKVEESVVDTAPPP